MRYTVGTQTAALAGVEDDITSDRIFDLSTPLAHDCDLQLLTFKDPEGKRVFWHSGAHVLGEAMENLYGAYLTHGPPLDAGFFYDSYMGTRSIGQDRFGEIEREANRIIGARQPFLRTLVTKQEALEMFGYSPFKTHLIRAKIPDGAQTTIYRCGSLVDLCTGPHIQNTAMLHAMKLTKASSAYWLGQSNNPQLQRVYGICFPSPQEMREYEKAVAEAEKRDHRNIGKKLELFFFDSVSPGSCFFLPDGAKIFNKMVGFMRQELKLRGYQEVITPNIFNIKLWKTSGHYKNFHEDMFTLQVEKQEFGMKPMNCPAHCMIFAEKLRSYKELPLRLSEFGVLHRNEYSGALAGLHRVRRFVQDDAHIFAREDQIESEVLGCLDLARYVYKEVFGLGYDFVLSTRPEKFMGEIKAWDAAEGILKKVLDKTQIPWKLNPGDGAFYGPKIDIIIKDAQGRGHQLGTVQLDFQLPARFNLQYRTETSEKLPSSGSPRSREIFPASSHDPEPFVWEEKEVKPGFARPVIIHRTVLGSIERFMGIFLENCAGKIPFWASPRQVRVVPVSDSHLEYARKLNARLALEGLETEVDESSSTLSKKIRNTQIEGWNYAAVVGEAEAKAGEVDVRSRSNERIGRLPLEKFLEMLKAQSRPKSSDVRKRIEEFARK